MGEIHLKELRKQQKMTQKHLAFISDVPRVCINRYESGRYMPSMKNAAKIAAALGVTVDELIRDQDDYDDKRHSGLIEEE